jgi:hypothetical protein
MTLVETNQVWEHWKGDHYTIVGTGFQESTGEAIVVYTKYPLLIGKSPLVNLWVRTLSDFLGMAEKGPRFTHRHGLFGGML